MGDDSELAFLREWLLELLRKNQPRWIGLGEIVHLVMCDPGADACAVRLKHRYCGPSFAGSTGDVIYAILVDLKKSGRVETHNGRFKYVNILQALAEAARD